MKTLHLLLALSFFSGQAFGDSLDTGHQPNVLVILADDLDYGELGCQGYTAQIPTPNIDSIAENGVRFTSGYVSGPYCSPTRAGFMTGRYQQRFGHEFNIQGTGPKGTPFGLSLEKKTIGNRLQAAGYKTGWFGKSHLGHQPQYNPLRRGFDEFFGFYGAAHSYLREDGGGRGNAVMRGTEPAPFTHTTDDFGREAVSFIERHRARPWFVYLAFNAVHGPLESTEKYLARFTAIEDRRRRTFAAMLSAMDENVGLVLAKIRELGQEEDTLVFFLSDNGGWDQTTSCNGPLRGVKGQTWEGGIRIPFMVQWKGRLPAGKVDDRPVIQLDILPTALAAAGVEVKPEWKLDGVNLLPYLTGENAGTPHEALYWRFGWQFAVRMGDWKLVKASKSKGFPGALPGDRPDLKDAELYNLAQDIGETNNLATAEPEKVKQLSAVWARWDSELIDPLWYHPLRAGKKAKRRTP